MNFLKVVLGIIIIFFCMGMGYFASLKYRLKKDFFRQLEQFNERFLNELSYSRRKLSDFLKEYTYEGDFKRITENFDAESEIPIKLSYLTDEERQDVSDYFGMLGRGSSLAQREYFSAQQRSIQIKKEESEREYKTRRELYIKLGLLSGLAIVILII